MKELFHDERIADKVLRRLADDCVTEFMKEREISFKGLKYEVESADFTHSIREGITTSILIHMTTTFLLSDKRRVFITTTLECVS